MLVTVLVESIDHFMSFHVVEPRVKDHTVKTCIAKGCIPINFLSCSERKVKVLSTLAINREVGFRKQYVSLTITASCCPTNQKLGITALPKCTQSPIQPRTNTKLDEATKIIQVSQLVLPHYSHSFVHTRTKHPKHGRRRMGHLC